MELSEITDYLGSVIAGAAGGIIVGLIGLVKSWYEIEKKKSISETEARTEFLKEIERMIMKIEISSQRFISRVDSEDEIPYHLASNAIHEVPFQEFIDYNTRNSNFANSQLQERCDEITEICMDLKHIQLGNATMNDPLSLSKSKKVFNLMIELHKKAVEVNDLLDEYFDP